MGEGFPGGSECKEFSCSAGDPGSIPGLGRSPREGNGYPLQYSCLENSMEREALWATVHKEMDTTEQLTLSDKGPVSRTRKELSKVNSKRRKYLSRKQTI